MKLISFQKLGENRDSPRLWLESRRLETLGFGAGIPFSVRRRVNGIRLRPVLLSNNHVSKRIVGGRVRPIIDIANRSLLSPLHGFLEIKVTAVHGQIDVVPSTRAFRIQRSLIAEPPFKTIEVFCGSGTLSAAIDTSGDFALIAGIEVEAKYADVWQHAHRRAILFQADIRRIHATEVPAHDVLVASIPCTSHSTLGRAKKSLAGKPELGDTGDLYLSVAQIVAHHLPLACVFENVPAFRTSLACLSLSHYLQRIGYFTTESIIDPLNEWNEPQDRRPVDHGCNTETGLPNPIATNPVHGHCRRVPGYLCGIRPAGGCAYCEEHRVIEAAQSPPREAWTRIRLYDDQSSFDASADHRPFLPQDQHRAICRNRARSAFASQRGS